MKRFLFVLIFSVLALSAAAAGIELPSILGSNMVLQRDAIVNIWGEAVPDSEITVIPSWEEGGRYTADSDAQGKWRMAMPTPGAGGPYSIRIEASGGETVTLENVMTGEVWFCAGQSNMDMPLKGYPSQPVHNALETIMSASKYPEIRMFKVGIAASEVPLDDCTGEWQVSTPGNAAEFSAVGYLFAKALADNIGIPIGIIGASWGATRIETWMDKSAALTVDPQVLSTNPDHRQENYVGAIFNAMVNPVTNFPVKGFIWYQGEDNKGFADKYHYYMSALVRQWRDAWGGGDAMPFYYSQIVPFNHDIPMHRFRGKINPYIVPLLVESQMKALDMIPNSGMAAGTDAGDAVDIHPARKDLIAQRLALLALSRTYGICGQLDDCGPVFENVRYGGGKAYVTFTSRSTLLPVNSLPVQGFEVAGADRVFFPAEAVVDGKDHVFGRTVIVSSADVIEPVAVRYAFHNVPPAANLTNTLGIPAYPFRTDDWDYTK